MDANDGSDPSRNAPPPRTKSKSAPGSTFSLAALHLLPRWVTWSRVENPGGRPTRKPHASTRRPSEWSTLPDLQPVEPLSRTPEGGVGLVFTGRIGELTADGAPVYVVGFDLDACVFADGSLSPWAQELLDAYPDTFVEFSPSGRGLHILLATRTLPAPVSVVNVPADAPPDVDKKPQVQVFGTGPAGYLTITERLYPGRPARLAVFPDLAWFEQRYNVGTFGPPAGSTELPTGEGEPPDFDTIDRVLAGSPMTGALLDGDWAALGLPSASEGWFRLSRAALRAAGGHGAVAARYLIARTAYGRGDVDSRDPARYARLEWVERDLARIASKTNDTGSAAFADDFVADEWVPPTRVLPSATDPWVLPFDAIATRRTPRRFLYKNFLPARGIAQFYGDPAAGKTPFAVSLAVHVAAGLPWFGHKLKRPGSVLYMIGEDETGIIDRFGAQLARTDPLLTLDRLPLYATTRPGQLIEPENRRRWVNEVREAMKRKPGPPLSLIVVDTQNRNFGPGNENDTEDMTKFVEQLDALGRQLDALVLVVHHTGHMNKDRARGSSVFFAAADAVFEVTRDPGSMAVYLSPRKSKNWAEPAPVGAALVPVRVGVDEDGDPVTAITLDPDSAAKVDLFPVAAIEAEHDEAELATFLRAMHEIGPNPVPKRELLARLKVGWRTIVRLLGVAQRDRLLAVRTTSTRRSSSYALTPLGRQRAGLPADPNTAASLQGVDPLGDE